MSEPSSSKTRRYFRTEAEYRWTRPKIAQFLRALAVTGSVSKAARSVGMSRQSAYNLRGRLMRDHGPAFGMLWDEAMAIALSRKCEAMIARMRAERGRQGSSSDRFSAAS